MDASSLASIPTDSLYKFMSIFGMIVLFFGATIPRYFRKNTYFQLLDVKKSSEILKIKSNVLKKNTENIDFDAALIRKKLNSVSDDFYDAEIENESKEADEIDLDHERLRSKCDAAEVEFIGLKIDTINLDISIKKIEYLVMEGRALLLLEALSLALGVFLVCWGFYLWYTKLQVFIDGSMHLK